MNPGKFLPAALGVMLVAACGGGGGGGNGTPAAAGLVGGPAGSVVSGDRVTPVTALAATLGEQPPDQEPAALSVADEADPFNPAAGAKPGADLADSEPVAVGMLPASAADPDQPHG